VVMPAQRRAAIVLAATSKRLSTQRSSSETFSAGHASSHGGHEEGADKRARSWRSSEPSGTPPQLPEPRSKGPTPRAAAAAATRQRVATGRPT